MSTAARPGLVFFGLSSFQVLAMFRRGIFYTFLSVYLRAYLGMSVTETTLFETLPMLCNIVFQAFVWGRLTDRLQLRRSLIVAGELLASVGHLGMWYLHAVVGEGRASGWVIIAGLSVIEIFWSMSNIGWSAYISDVYAPAERNAVQGRLASLGGAGRMLGALAGGFLYDRAGLAYPGWGFKEGAIFFVSAAAMCVSVLPLLFIPEGGLRPGQAAGPKAEASGSGRAGGTGEARAFAVFLVALLLVNSGINSLVTFKYQYLDLDSGFDASARTIGLVSNVESGTLIAVGFLLGALGRAVGIPSLLVIGALSGIASLGLYAVAPSIGLIYAASVFKGVADGCIASSSYAYASILIPPERRGRYFALYNATFALSWGTTATLLTGPLIDGLIAAGRPAAAAYRAGVVSCIALMVLGLALLLGLFAATRRRGRAGARAA